MRVHDIEIADEKFILNDTEGHVLGPGLVLVNCELVLRCSARALTMTNVRLVGCRIVARKCLKNFQMWCGAHIEGCEFSGHFDGNDFGLWEDQATGGFIGDCDFTSANLDACRFMNADVDSLALPTWPCFTVINPASHADELLAVDWPAKLVSWANLEADELDITSASVSNALSLISQYGGTAGDLRSRLEQLDFIRM